LMNESMKKQRIVICGSMAFYNDMVQQSRMLKKEGIDTVIPESDDPFLLSISEESFQDVKLNASMRHLRKIRDHEKTYGILVINKDKHGIRDYIGPNTFAEIAVALAHYKKIYLFQGMPAFYQDELRAWNVICLDNDISKLVNAYKKDMGNWIEEQQLELFDGLF